MAEKLKRYRNSFRKDETYIRVGPSRNSLSPFPTPSSFKRTLSDVDKDPYTDLKGYTHRNRVRHDVENFTLTYNVLSDKDMKKILNAISPAWFYCEITNLKTGSRSVHKMYASDKQWDTYVVEKDDNNNWVEVLAAFTVSFVEE